MAKFLSYEYRLEIESCLKAHMTFTEIGKKLGRDRTTITKEIKKLYLNVANRKSNNVWFLVQVYTGNELIAKTGIFYQDEYVEKIACSRNLSANDKLLVKVLAYEPDTYHSEGVAQISTIMAGE